MLNPKETVVDYNNSQNNSQDITNPTVSTYAEMSKVTYSSVTKSTPKPVFPKKDQAIIIHADPAFKLIDYVKASR